MIYIEDDDLKELKKAIKNIDEIIEADDIDELLEQVNDLIVFNLGKEYELTAVSGKYQDIYDRLYNENR